MMAVEASAQICSDAQGAKPHEYSPKKFTESYEEQAQVVQVLAALCHFWENRMSQQRCELWSAPHCAAAVAGCCSSSLSVGAPSQAGSRALKGMQSREGDGSCCEEGRKHPDQSSAGIFHCCCAGGSCWQQPCMRQHCWRTIFFSILT